MVFGKQCWPVSPGLKEPSRVQKKTLLSSVPVRIFSTYQWGRSLVPVGEYHEYPRESLFEWKINELSLTGTDDPPRVLRILTCTASAPHGHWWSSSRVLNIPTGTLAIGLRVLKIVYTGSLWQVTQLLFSFQYFQQAKSLGKKIFIHHTTTRFITDAIITVIFQSVISPNTPHCFKKINKVPHSEVTLFILLWQQISRD